MLTRQCHIWYTYSWWFGVFSPIYVYRNMNGCVEKDHIHVIWKLLSGTGRVLVLKAAYMRIYICTMWLFARISFTWQFWEQQSVVDKLFLIICKLFITNYNQCGWNDWLTSVSRLMLSKSQRAYCNYLEYGHTVILDSGRSYAIAAFLNCPSFPSPGDQLYIQRNCLVYETDLCSRRNLFFTEFSAHLGLWNIKGTCRNQDSILITASACSAEAGAAWESISVTLGSRCIWMV